MPKSPNVILGVLLIIANSAIGIIQELRAKQTLDKLAIVGQTKPLVVMPNDVMLDDIIELGPGDQIVVDGVIVEETNLEVDESLLTGEADPIDNDAGDRVMSGRGRSGDYRRLWWVQGALTGERRRLWRSS
jgi:cation-transporting ATPase E